jgi:GNAT superfamily N-acetyltransferase
VQYPARGPRGISYYAGHPESFDGVIDCLLFRDKSGKVRGILNHYPIDFPPLERAGAVNVWVEPRWRRRGVGMKLIAEADRRWRIDFSKQRCTNAGVRLIEAYLARIPMPA